MYVSMSIFCLCGCLFCLAVGYVYQTRYGIIKRPRVTPRIAEQAQIEYLRSDAEEQLPALRQPQDASTVPAIAQQLSPRLLGVATDLHTVALAALASELRAIEAEIAASRAEVAAHRATAP